MTGQPATLLSLEQFRRVLGMNPYHFWQLSNDSTPLQNVCDDLLFEQPWQNADAMSRASIRQAIDVAERKLREWLRYDVAPRYQTSIVDWPRRFNQTQQGYGDFSAIDRSISVALPYKQVRAVGALTRVAIGDAAVTYADTNNDGLLDTFTATIATTVTDTSQIAAYFTTADQWDELAPLDAWKIAPVVVSIVGGQATVRGSIWQIVRPILYADFSTPPQYFDPADEAIYAESLTIYREYINPNGETVNDAQATLIWETGPWPSWCLSCGTSPYEPNASDPAGVGKAVARVGIRDAANGIVTPGQAVYTDSQWSRVNWATCYQPDRVEVRYLAGLPLVNGQMDRTWQEFVTYMALAELEGPICACESVRARLHHWQFDLARTSGANDEAYAISTADLDNPFGTRRGHIHVWRRVKETQQVIGYSF